MWLILSLGPHVDSIPCLFWEKYNAPLTDMVSVYICYIRPTLEQACQVWHSGISSHLSHTIECVQKRACRIILGYQHYENYAKALELLGISSLESRRNQLFLKFGIKLLNSPKFRNMLPAQKAMCASRKLRDSTSSGLIIPRCRTERYKQSTIPALSRIL